MQGGGLGTVTIFVVDLDKRKLCFKKAMATSQQIFQ
jgi:hypothetical protein